MLDLTPPKIVDGSCVYAERQPTEKCISERDRFLKHAYDLVYVLSERVEALETLNGRVEVLETNSAKIMSVFDESHQAAAITRSTLEKLQSWSAYG